MSAERKQISVVINAVLRKQPSYKLLERESIKRALSSGVFGVLQKDAANYLPHPEVASTGATRKAPTARVETDSEEEREIARELRLHRDMKPKEWMPPRLPRLPSLLKITASP
ncbi:hypothetical protein R1sor_016067 [Riccia sorocarpa]|uniref:Uncharacterized protein n=1 Tax=Riccia sorocarpa TaxID=122646 RepID=A0ABD3HEB7_9MARC